MSKNMSPYANEHMEKNLKCQNKDITRDNSRLMMDWISIKYNV